MALPQLDMTIKMNQLIYIIICILLSLSIQAQDIEKIDIETQVEKVTVFLDGAQIHRSHQGQFDKGVHELKFTGLSTYVDKNSIRVNGQGPLTILNVEHKVNYLEGEQEEKSSANIRKQIRQIEDSINLLNVENEIIESQLGFLHENRKVPASPTSQLASLKAAAKYYREEVSELKKQQLLIKDACQRLQQRKKRLRKQLGDKLGETNPTSSTIIVNVDMKSPSNAIFKLDYLVGGAGWYPTYDIRVEKPNDPIQLVYKANVRQKTGVDWDKVQLTFSSAQPKENRLVPELRPYYIGYAAYDSNYRNFDKVLGKLIDKESGEPLIFASVSVLGTTIGTQTDVDGKFSLMLPKWKNKLKVSYVGYKSKVVPVSSPNMTIEMDSGVDLESVVVVDYSVPLVNQDQIKETRVGGTRGKQAPMTNTPIPLQTEESLMNFEFVIDQAYSIPNGTNKRTLEMKTQTVDAEFHYYAVPKLDELAYLVAGITGWQEYQLIAGEAQVYYENTFIGSSLIDPSTSSDTLSFSLGPDKNISIERELIKDFSENRFFGSRTEVTKAYRFRVQNNKSTAVSISLVDQIPISKIEKVEVDVLETSGAKPYPESGKVEWTLELKPGEKAERILRYQVTVPKGQGKIVE